MFSKTLAVISILPVSYFWLLLLAAFPHPIAVILFAGGLAGWMGAISYLRLNNSTPIERLLRARKYVYVGLLALFGGVLFIGWDSITTQRVHKATIIISIALLLATAAPAIILRDIAQKLQNQNGT